MCYGFSVSKFSVIGESDQRFFCLGEFLQNSFGIETVVGIILMSDGHQFCLCTSVGKHPVLGNTGFPVVDV